MMEKKEQRFYGQTGPDLKRSSIPYHFYDLGFVNEFSEPVESPPCALDVPVYPKPKGLTVL